MTKNKPVSRLCGILFNFDVSNSRADRQLIVYGRMSGENKCAVIINNRGESRSVRVPVWELGITDEDAITRMMLSDEKGYNAGHIDYRADHGWLTLDVPAHSGVLLSSGALV